MFEIRVICHPAQAERVTRELADTFTTGSVRQHPTRDGQRTRLYVTADHKPTDNKPWPTPREAYAQAPSVISEIGWTAQAARAMRNGEQDEREFFLRKAALLDRIALDDEKADAHGDACDLARQAGRRLMDRDGADNATTCDARDYVRQQYAAWAKHNQRAALVADGRCPNCQWRDYQCNCAEHPNA
ncbi:hypothetical protein QCN29_07710 [Streptomyces sp. HNM0663]|uniref:Uncharacterized protein n=1 Tax=Streptomyces chengmaiensis TaxID=3040919 RepID=A0ABT6HJ11_9ACTN|nr:hypothetical protein [Streptomyces chengmaiensis]MDH2388673.1 hypothetical protein [Streptomyces chengmaiensis]